jgi:hypothetical protein
MVNWGPHRDQGMFPWRKRKHNGISERGLIIFYSEIFARHPVGDGASSNHRPLLASLLPSLAATGQRPCGAGGGGLSFPDVRRE